MNKKIIKEINKYSIDFIRVQNYLLTLVAQKVIKKTSYILYCYYRVRFGLKPISCGYTYIKKNLSISKGSISKGSIELERVGVIKIDRGDVYVIQPCTMTDVINR